MKIIACSTFQVISLPVGRYHGIGGRPSDHFVNKMAAVSTGNEIADLNKQTQPTNEPKVDKNGVGEMEIPLSPDHAVEEARKEEIRAKIRTVSGCCHEFFRDAEIFLVICV